jgi:hypothetical protein
MFLLSATSKMLHLTIQSEILIVIEISATLKQ